jgi:dihydrofolate synthase/folylpolyglutamate synthase
MRAGLKFYSRLEDLNEFKFDFSLERVRSALILAGSPQDAFDCVHIAGSNGKGSTAWYLSNIFMMHGLKTGTYTSPHLIDVKERIAINGKNVKEKLFISEGLKLFSVIAKNRIKLTYFEFLTVLAFMIFKAEKVRIAVIEAGLGGRYDATNVGYKNKLLSVITSISLEHTDYLGKTRMLILKEKEEIAGKGMLVVNVDGALLKNHLKKRFVNRVVFADELYPVKGMGHRLGRIVLDFVSIVLDTRMVEPVQAKNLATVLSCLKVMESSGYSFDPDKVKKAVLKTKVLGRMSWNAKGYFLSVAHNPGAFKEVLKTLALSYPCKRTVFVFSLLKDKDAGAIFKEASHFKNISFVLTSIDNPRAISIAKMKEYVVKYGIRFKIETDNNSALKLARKLAGEGIVVVGGSFYLISKFV